MVPGGIRTAQRFLRLFRAKSSHVGDHHFGQADNGVERQSQYGWYDEDGVRQGRLIAFVRYFWPALERERTIVNAAHKLTAGS